jgi:hypothetical protein
MRAKAYTLVFALCGVLSLWISRDALAGWGIFDSKKNATSTDYFQINNLTFDTTESKITLYQDMLPNGLISIRSKVADGTKPVKIQISLNGKDRWEDPKVSEDGSFELSFKPAIGYPYDIYLKITDADGKTNDVDATHKTLVVSDQPISMAIKEALDKLISAYRNKDVREFMKRVSDDFAGDDAVLDSAIRKDATYLDDVDIKYSISSVATGANGNVYATVFFNQFLLSVRTGVAFKNTATTEFVFRTGDTGLKLFAMKNPLIFGLSNAGDVATGTVYSATNQFIIILEPDGSVRKLNFSDGIQEINAL